MSIKKILILLVVVVFLSDVFLLVAIFDRKETTLNVVEVHDMEATLAEQWESLNQDFIPQFNYGLDYVVLNNDNQLILASRKGLNEDLNAAIENRDTIIDIKLNQVTLGKLIIYNHTKETWIHYKTESFVFSIIVNTFLAVIIVFYSLFLNQSILLPFKKLQYFAKHVAEGNLDLPLEMDKGNHFGAFTESFDLMRDELKKARENERRANQSKKELVASLSHDIKTPVASIKALSEILYTKSQDENVRKQLEIINSKSDQINTLITNMFNASLEELQELKVAVIEESSRIIYHFIEEADYNQRVTILKKDECIVFMDPIRLSQVIDNILSNAYKYAGSLIQVAFTIVGNFLEVSFRDFGGGVSEDELPLLFNKYYRAQNANGKSGTGLGLYISKYLVNKMQGEISGMNTDDGFMIQLKLRIS